MPATRICWRRAKIDNETFSLRAERKLEDRSGANALEPDALHAYRARRNHWHRRRHVDGHGDRRNFESGSTRAWPSSAMTFSTSRNGRGRMWTIGGTTATARKSRPNTPRINRMIAATPNSNLVVAVPTSSLIDRLNMRQRSGQRVRSAGPRRISSSHRQSILKKADSSTNSNRAAAPTLS